MNTGFALQDIEFIDIANIKRLCFIIQPHSVVFSGVFKTQLVHEFGPFRLRDNISLDVRLLYEDAKCSVLVPTKAENSHVRIREDSIMDDNPVQRKPEDIIMLEGNELSNQPARDIEEYRTLCTYIVCLRDR